MWNREGQRVAGVYLNAYTVSGVVQESRVKYGGKVQHTVKMDTPVEVFGRIAEVLLLDEEDLFNTDFDDNMDGDSPDSALLGYR
jgi:hypothetical protein